MISLIYLKVLAAFHRIRRLCVRTYRRYIKLRRLGVGFRHSTFHPDVQPSASYWIDVAERIKSSFFGSTPEVIWIISRTQGKGTLLSFPIDSDDPMICGLDFDLNEHFLSECDANGLRVWLQLEPSFVEIEKLINIVLKRYRHHPCLIGVGVDIEWYRPSPGNSGCRVTDDVCRSWLAATRQHNAKYRIFLKHWLIEKMPVNMRDGILFVSDGQSFRSLGEMTTEFRRWSRAFSASEVAFQIGYPSDRHWWSHLSNPARTIGNRILFFIPNAIAIYWVDFTVMEVFPPRKC